MSLAADSESMLNAAFTADAMSDVLQQIAGGAGAEGATLTYSHGSAQLGAIFSQSLVEHVPDYLRSDRPADPRPSRVNPSLVEGFRLDQDDFSADELARDPYYHDFLAPLGFGWHACALLAGEPDGPTLHLTLRRTSAQGAFDRDALKGLSTQLPLIRATARVMRMMGGVMGDCEPVPDPRRSLFGFDANGKAFVIHEDRSAGGVLELHGLRLTAWNAEQQAHVNDTIQRANSQSRQVSAILTDTRGDWWLFTVSPPSLIVPVWMTPLLSWASLVPYQRSADLNLARARRMAELFGLSSAEARVVALIGDARAVVDAARVLRSSPGTVRNHLKSIFAKVGVRRQAELVAVLSRF